MLTKSFAKINIGLHIIRKRDDGYHDIQTVFHHINLFDEVVFTKLQKGIHLTTNLRYVPTDARNLCVQAARKLFHEVGYAGGVHIHLKKNIPVGAGLGGGSSNAACVLLHLPSFLSFSIPLQTLHNLAAQLGSDVPYFLEDGSAYATGKGEHLQYFSLNVPYWIVVVMPPAHVSTKWAYGNLEINSLLPQFNLKEFLKENISHPTELVNKVRNDFEPLVFKHHEEIMRTKEILYRTGAEFALMSGSGSSVFGFFSNATYAAETADFFSKKYPTFLTPPNWRAPSVVLEQ